MADFVYNASAQTAGLPVGLPELDALLASGARPIARDAKKASHLLARVRGTIEALSHDLGGLRRTIDELRMDASRVGSPVSLSPVDALRFASPEEIETIVDRISRDRLRTLRTLVNESLARRDELVALLESSRAFLYLAAADESLPEAVAEKIMAVADGLPVEVPDVTVPPILEAVAQEDLGPDPETDELFAEPARPAPREPFAGVDAHLAAAPPPAFGPPPAFTAEHSEPTSSSPAAQDEEPDPPAEPAAERDPEPPAMPLLPPGPPHPSRTPEPTPDRSRWTSDDDAPTPATSPTRASSTQDIFGMDARPAADDVFGAPATADDVFGAPVTADDVFGAPADDVFGAPSTADDVFGAADDRRGDGTGNDPYDGAPLAFGVPVTAPPAASGYEVNSAGPSSAADVFGVGPSAPGSTVAPPRSPDNPFGAPASDGLDDLFADEEPRR